MKDYNITRSFEPLEDLFDNEDVAKNSTMVPIEKGVEDVNIGVVENTR